MATREGYRWFRGGWQPSEAQRRVLDELAAGRTNAEIAIRLGLSAGTVKWHIAQLLAETGCTDRAALTCWWQGRSKGRPPFLTALGWLGRLAAAAATLSVGLLLLLAGVYGAPRLLDRLELRPRFVRVVRPPEPLPIPMSIPTPTPRPGVLLAAQFIWAADGAPDPLSGVRGLAVDAAGNVYAQDVGNHRIVKFDPNGRVLTRWGSRGDGPGQFRFMTTEGWPGVIAVAPDGTVYVADASGRVQHFDADGGYLGEWGNKGRDPGQIDQPFGMAIDAHGRLYISDIVNHRVQAFDPNGALLVAWGRSGSGPGEFYGPANIAVAPDGTVYVADSFNDRVQHFDPMGNYLDEFGSLGVGPGQFRVTAGIAVDADGTIYVADNRGGHRIEVFDATGRYLGEWGEFGHGGGQFDHVGGLVLDGRGHLYVADPFNSRIQKFRLP